MKSVYWRWRSAACSGVSGPSAANSARLPQLPLVLAEVLHQERLDAFDVEQALAGGVDGEAAEVAGDPAAAELLGDRRRRAGAAEAVEDEVVVVGGGVDDAVEEGFGFLGVVARRSLCHERIDSTSSHTSCNWHALRSRPDIFYMRAMPALACSRYGLQRRVSSHRLLWTAARTLVTPIPCVVVSAALPVPAAPSCRADIHFLPSGSL